MKKKLVIINGAMGVGKTTVCSVLNKKLENSVWLDGDWCWMINPFTATDETKKMVEKNIRYLLRNFLTHSTIEYVVLSWVLHTDELLSMILEWVDDLEFDVIKITLSCSNETLKKRLEKDLKAGVRYNININKSFERLHMCNNLINTIKINTDFLSIPATIEKILKTIQG